MVIHIWYLDEEIEENLLEGEREGWVAVEGADIEGLEPVRIRLLLCPSTAY